MNNIIEKLNKAKALYVVIAFFIGLIATAFVSFHQILNKNDEILATIQTTQQMALKSVIWNDSIPITERASACDVYLNAGYNSMTKKECQVIIEKGSQQGLFSMLEKESNNYDGNNSKQFNGSFNGYIGNTSGILGYAY